MPSRLILIALLAASAAVPQTGKPPRVHWQLLSTATGDLPLPWTATQQTASLACDLDKDGVADFVVASRRAGAAVVWYRRHKWGWETHRIDGDGLPIEAGGACMDVDGDGDLDIIFGEDNSGNKVWWWENPYPHYDPQASWKRRAIKNSGGNKHHDQLVGDFDGDGRPDLVFWNQGKAARKLWLARVPKDPRATEPWPLVEVFSWTEGDYEGLARGDIDRDGRIDIVGGGMWFKHLGGDRFEANVIDKSQSFSRAAVAQLKKGGAPEVIFAPGDRDGPLQWYELVSGKWVAHKLLNEDVVHGHSLDVGDADGDGNIDILCGEMRKWGPGEHAASRMWVFFGDGKGGFEATELARGYGHHEARFADLDGDGRLDILDKPYTWAPPAIQIWLNRAAPKPKLALDKWQRHVIDAERPWRAVFVYPADLDGDGRPDIVTGAWWYRNPGTPGGTWVRKTIGAPLHNVAAVFDFDNDGRPDILGTGWQGKGQNPSFAWARNNGGGLFTIFDNIPKAVGDFLQGAAAGRLRPGGPVEVALSWHKNGNGVQMLTVPANPAKEPWEWRTMSETNQQEQLSAADIDRDGRRDLLLGTRWLRNEEKGWPTHVVNPTDGDPDRSLLADINRDGRLDAVVGFESISKPGKVAWYEQGTDAAAAWTERIVAADVTGPMSIDVADMDGDGDLDVVVGEHNLKEPGTSRLLVFENLDGKGGKWARHVAWTGDEHHVGAQVVDVDGDGDLDIVSIGWGHARVLLYENKAIDRNRSLAEEGGRFLRVHSFVPGLEHGNPVSNKRFRVNAPDAVLHPSFGARSETKGSGMMQIEMKEDLALLDGADLALELWGGHHGTANKRVSLNGRSTYAIPEVGTAADHCTHHYPSIPLRITDLVNGYNAIQFACDKGSSFWGHYIVEGASLRAVLRPDHPDLVKLGLAGFEAKVTAAKDARPETMRLSLDVPASLRGRVASVRFQAFYDGFDENGDRQEPGWHGFTLNGKAVGYAGTAGAPPVSASWDVSMLPAQGGVAVRAFVSFKERPELVFVTKPVTGLAIGKRANAEVKLYSSPALPAPFLSRVNRKRAASIPLDVGPEQIERAELHVTVWDGGCGKVQDCVSLNGKPVKVTGKGAHDVIYSRLPIPPSMLRKGENVFEMAADTEHHGVEILLPGPVLVVRSKKK